MRGSVDSIKQRLDIVEIAGNYLKLEKAGQNFKGKCPFHNEKTGSFLVSPVRQTYYCFGCGAKGDIFTLVEELEGVDFKGALKMLAEKAGIELSFERGESKTEKDKLYAVLDDATLFFESELKKNLEIEKYLISRGLNKETISQFRIGYIPEEWRSLSTHLTGLGYSPEVLLKAGLIKYPDGGESEKNPYDVFRGRIIFPLMDQSGRIIAFSGRAVDPKATAKYLNSPDTVLFTKSEVLYGLDRAKEEIRKKNYTVLVEGQLDLVLSHQAGVKNTVASSGTAFTVDHLERLKRLSARIILGFDGDEAGEKAAEKSTMLGLGLGMEVKIASLPEGKDPADLVKNNPDDWKEILRKSTHAIEHVLAKVLAKEKDPRKSGKLIEKKVLPLLSLLGSSIERAHFVSLIAKHSGIREDVLWEDLSKIKSSPPQASGRSPDSDEEGLDQAKNTQPLSRRMRIEERLAEVGLWQKELSETSIEHENLAKEQAELTHHLLVASLEEERSELQGQLLKSENREECIMKIEMINRRLDEEKRKVM